MIEIISAPKFERDSKKEITKILFEDERVKIELIASPKGFSSPKGFWYDQDEDEFVMVLNGAADIRFDDGKIIKLIRRDSIYIPAHLKHRVSNVYSPTTWLCYFIKQNKKN